MPKLSKLDKQFLRSIGIRPTAMPRTAIEKWMDPWSGGKVRLFRPPDEVLDVKLSEVETILEGNTEEPWQVIWTKKEWRRALMGLASDDPTTKLLLESGLEISRANWLYIAYMGNPPAEPMELPWYLQRTEDEDV